MGDWGVGKVLSLFHTVEPPTKDPVRKGQPPNKGHTSGPLSHRSSSFLDLQGEDNFSTKTTSPKVSSIQSFHCSRQAYQLLDLPNDGCQGVKAVRDMSTGLKQCLQQHKTWRLQNCILYNNMDHTLHLSNYRFCQSMLLILGSTIKELI